MDYRIFIPTLGRVNKQVTLESLAVCPRLLSVTSLVVAPHEYEEYSNRYGLDVDIICLPDGVKGIARTRQWILDSAATPDIRYIFMLDDDMVFFKRIPGTIKLKQTTPDELEDMFDYLYCMMGLGYGLVGVSARQGNNNIKDDFAEVTRQMNFHGIDRFFFREHGFQFNRLPVMEDFHLLLDMFTKGFPNFVLYDYCWNQVGSGAAGGCSTYRTAIMQEEAAKMLKEHYPDYVTLVTKKSKTAWQGMKTRTDVRIQWKKAYKDSEG